MKQYDCSTLLQVADLTNAPDNITLFDHLNGFVNDNNNAILRRLDDLAKQDQCITQVHWHQILPTDIAKKYANLQFIYDHATHDTCCFNWALNYKQHPELDFTNFICSFNGNGHIGRILLVSILAQFEWNNPLYVSKNFKYDYQTVSDLVTELIPEQTQFYNKFFANQKHQGYYGTIVNLFGNPRILPKENHYNFNLVELVSKNFIHIVSETMSTSSVPFVSEKFLYSIISRGLWVANAQVNWHQHLVDCYGFKLYNKIFDYTFDSITNPVERLLTLITMLGKFANLDAHDWHDLYLLEQDTIEYNYDHFFSENFFKFKLDAATKLTN